MKWSSVVPQLPRQLWLLATAAFVNFLGYMVMPFLVLYLTQVTGFSIETAGALLTLFGIGNILGAWAGGQLSDRIGSANVLILSFLISAAAMAVVPALSDVFSIGCVLSLLAFANGAFRPAYDASVIRLCPREERPRAYAVYVVAINIGAGIATAIAGHLFAFKPSMIFYVDALTSLLAATAVFFFLDRRTYQSSVTSKDGNQSAATTLSPYKSTPFLIACLAACVVDAVAKQSSSTLPLYVSSAYGMTPQAFGNLLTIGHITFAIGILPVSNWVKSKSQLAIAITGMCIVALGFGALPFGSGIILLVVLYLLMMLGQLLFYPAVMAIVMGQAAENQGKGGAYMGLYRTMQAMAGVAAPLIGTFLYVQTTPEILWLGCAVLTMISAFSLGFGKVAVTQIPSKEAS